MGKGKKKKKKNQQKQKKKINPPTASGTDRINPSISEQPKHPVFCFRYLVKDYNISSLTKKERALFVSKLETLSGLDWNTIENAGKHQLGYEHIPISDLKFNIPKAPELFTPEVKKIKAFRCFGKSPFLAHRKGAILHIIAIDPNFKAYEH
jgi:hypothetical protein